MMRALYSSPMPRKNATASSRDFTLRATGRASATIFAISASMASRSSGLKPGA